MRRWIVGAMAAGLLAIGLVVIDAGQAASSDRCPRPSSPAPLRLAGDDRYATAATAAEWADAEVGLDDDVAVLASGNSSADAAVAAVLAGRLDAPLLLSGADHLHPEAAEALRRLDQDGDRGHVLVVGGTSTVREAVRADLHDLGFSSERIAGSTRYTTAEAADATARSRAGDPSGPAYVASGVAWPDVVVAAAAAGSDAGQLLLVDVADPQRTADAVRGRAVVVVGGPSSVPASVYERLASQASSIRRLAGVDRASTAAAVAAAHPTADALIAAEQAWADAIVAAAAGAATSRVMVLTAPDALSVPAGRQLGGRDIVVVGGPVAVLDHVASDAGDAAAGARLAPQPVAIPAGCTTVRVPAGGRATLTVSTAEPVRWTDLWVTVHGPVDGSRSVTEHAIEITVEGLSAGSGGLAMSATVTDGEGRSRVVRFGWYLEVEEASRSSEGYLVAGGRSEIVGSGGSLTAYTVEIADGLESRQDIGQFAAAVDSFLLQQPNGWTSRGSHRLARVDNPGEARVRVLLASPRTVDAMCARIGVDTGGRYSCWTGRFAAINADRWFEGVSHVPDLHLYRTYLINHEVGHALGHAHEGCPASGALSPVMMQLSKSTYGCEPNGWPYP